MNISRTLAVAAVLALGSFNAQAAWVILGDPNPVDMATNPDFDVPNQSAPTVAAWLQDLLDLSAPPSLTSQGDIADGTASIAGLGEGLLSIHYGGGGLYGSPGSGGYDLAFGCTTACSSINLAAFGPGNYTQATSNFRFYGSTSVPEPMTLALVGLGLVSVAFMRRRRVVA